MAFVDQGRSSRSRGRFLVSCSSQAAAAGDMNDTSSVASLYICSKVLATSGIPRSVHLRGPMMGSQWEMRFRRRCR